jgi:hypothetical protein
MLYKLKIPYTIDYFECIANNTSNPYMNSTYKLEPPGYIVLLKKYHQWFIENNIWYDLEKVKNDNTFEIHSYVIFENKSDAMLFKLTLLGV